ncbi:hypothetical protein CA850_13515 [Micromonospora echinospora]|uniref:Uncharacterized protein n=1 Tax=Micromonospora echinospora TaxID=1877 RepID=A0A1C4YGZ8_MICEC|nr:hypothetical protein [Micromonospora echinospora]OZV81146.1 hypothetical protein CA850_13515 [Micromonospora echinospora]SCF19978.1 hypothetical protein GA0070618_3977 [Micromonospora echinospora]
MTGGGYRPEQVGSGLGRSMCVELAWEGAKVVVSDLSLANAASDDASFIHGHTIPVDGGSPIR